MTVLSHEEQLEFIQNQALRVGVREGIAFATQELLKGIPCQVKERVIQDWTEYLIEVYFMRKNYFNGYHP